MKLRWFLSGKVRQATEMCNHVEKLLNAQRDILSAPAVEAVTSTLGAARAAVVANVGDDLLDKQMTRLEEVGAKWFKPYPHAEWRENIEVFLVAIVVAMAIRTFFLQPFKIPTGSMEPTLYGIEIQDLREQPGFVMPNALGRFWDLIVHGTIYHNIIAPANGEVMPEPGPLAHIFGVINKQVIWVKYEGQSDAVPITIYCGPDDHLMYYSGLSRRSVFTKGDPIVRFKETTGDHLFVDRFTYNFRRPERGEIIVFKTEGIEGIPNPDQFYIKRLIGLPGETVSIGEDRHVRIDGHRLDATTPHFSNVYGFDPKSSPEDGKSGRYSGHVLDPRSHIQSPEDSIPVPTGHFVAFGDNTVNSLDSRYWGPLPEQNVIGKSFFVYWPITDRFGWGYKR
jgi:signal peptidase I